MRVLHAFKDVYPPTFGGVEQHIWDITRSLGPEFQFSVLTGSRSRSRQVENLDGVQILRSAELGRVLSTPITPSWWSDLRRVEADVLHVHLPNPIAEMGCLARLPPRAPVVASFHADINRNPGMARWYLPVQHLFLSRADRLVVGSPVLADTSPTLAAHRERLTVIPYGVDPDEWPAAPEAVEAIRRTHGGAIVLFLGRLVGYKGVDVLMQAMASVDATLLVVGDGPARPALEAASPGVRANVRFVGNVSNEYRSAYYRAADIFVLPAVTRAESFGIAMLEAMAHGTPAISTEVGTGTSWVNLQGETGLVVPPCDPQRLAAAITTLLSDDAMRRKLGVAAAARARDHFSKQAMVDRLAALYREVAAGTRS